MLSKKLNITTSARVQMLCIDDLIFKTLSELKVQSGIGVIFVPHTTAGITINENADPDVTLDIIREINKIIPFSDSYHHIEGNSAAHIKASLFGSSVTLLIEEGRPILGTWQSIYFCEFDGPRKRTVHFKILSDVGTNR